MLGVLSYIVTICFYANTTYIPLFNRIISKLANKRNIA